MEECLEMTDSNGGYGINDLETDVFTETKFKWKLAKDSNIKSLVSITLKAGSTNVFQEKPKKVPGAEEFDGHAVKTDKELRGEYDIVYIPKDSNSPITIDPYIRVKLSQ